MGEPILSRRGAPRHMKPSHQSRSQKSRFHSETVAAAGAAWPSQLASVLFLSGLALPSILCSRNGGIYFHLLALAAHSLPRCCSLPKGIWNRLTRTSLQQAAAALVTFSALRRPTRCFCWRSPASDDAFHPLVATCAPAAAC